MNNKTHLTYEVLKRSLDLRKLVLIHNSFEEEKKAYELLQQIYLDEWEVNAYLILHKQVNEPMLRELFLNEFKVLVSKDWAQTKIKGYSNIQKLIRKWRVEENGGV